MEESGEFLLPFEGLVEFSCVAFGRVVDDDVSVFRKAGACVEHMCSGVLNFAGGAFSHNVSFFNGFGEEAGVVVSGVIVTSDDLEVPG